MMVAQDSLVLFLRPELSHFIRRVPFVRQVPFIRRVPFVRRVLLLCVA